MKRIVLLCIAICTCSTLFAQLPTAQALPFSQDWSNNGLITVDDNWSGVPGIIGFRGDGITGATGADPQTLLADDNPGVVDVIANQTNPNTNNTGGVAEFHLANSVVALQGSGTADAPYILIGINTSCLSDITVSYNVRDIDGSADNAVQQVALHYRVGNSGNYTNVPAAYIADATTGPNMATLVTPVSVVLPAAANNQSVVYLRIMTTNAAGNDEWVGIDDISINGTPISAVISGNGNFCISGNLPITVDITGGTGPYTVNYTDGVNNFSETNYTSGAVINQPVSADATFTLVSVTDAGGCTATSLSGAATAFVSPSFPSIAIATQTDPTCANNDGAIDIDVTGGVTPYTYSWATANGSGLNANAEDQTGLSAGTYDVTATDDNGCTGTASATLSLPPGCGLDYYWVGGSGLWSDHNNHWATTSGGNVFHDQVPTSMDNVYFDANSGFMPGNNTVTIDQTIIYCMDMDWTGVTNTPVLSGPNDKQVWIYGSLKLVPEMEWVVNGEVRFRAFQSGKTITSAGQAFDNNVFFDGTGGGWMLLDAFWVHGNLQHQEGSLNTNGQDVKAENAFVSTGSADRVLVFGSSNIYVGGGNVICPAFGMVGPLNFDAGTSTIHMLSLYNVCGDGFNGGDQAYYNLVCEVPTIVTGNNTFHSAIFLKNAELFGSNHFDNLTFSAGYSYKLSPGGTQTINPGGTFNGSGNCMDFVTITSQTPGIAAQIEQASGMVDLTYVVFQDIHAVGGATFNAANSADLGNNTGWNFLPVTPRNLYWVGGGGNWNDVAHWSLSSGGAGGECIPTPFDNVFFDQNSGFNTSGEEVSINVAIAFCHTMDWTGVANTPVLGGNSLNRLFIFGSLTFVSGMDLAFGGEVHFMARTTGKVITSAGKAFNNNVFFDGTGGGWMLLDAFWVHGNLQHQEGSLNTNGQDVKAENAFVSTGSADRVLVFGSSNIYVGGGNVICPAFGMVGPLNFDAGTSTIHMLSLYNVCGDGFNGGDQAYYNLVCEVPTIVTGNNTFHSAIFLKNAELFGSNHFDNLTFSAGYSYKLSPGGTQTINPGGTFNGSGNCMDFVTITSQTPGIAAQIEQASGMVDLTYVVFQDIHAVGGATFNAANSADLGNNTGWNFLPVTPRNLYWVGGGGNWNDVAHWSLSSGGAGGECIPTPFDNVFFDQNSGFNTSGEEVSINVAIAFCHTMDWTGVANTPVLGGNSLNRLFIFGSLTFVSGMDLAFGGEVHFMARTTGKVITSAGKAFNNNVFFDGTGGGWMLLDAFWVHGNLQHQEGSLNTNGQDVKAENAFVSTGSADRVLVFGSSNIYVGGGNVICPAFGMVGPLNFDAGTSTIHMLSLYNVCGDGFNGGDQAYYNLVCEVPTIVTGNNYFYTATFLNDGAIEGNNSFENLTFTPGFTYTLESGSTQTITPLGNFVAEGYGGFPIEIKSSQLGQQATLHKDGDPICLDFLYLTDMVASGSSFQYAGANSDDVFNNDGWIFEACPGCFNAPPLPAPTLDPASVIAAPPGQQVTLILENLPAGYEAVWFDSSLTNELYAGVANLFQPVVNESTVFYGAIRELATGCVSELLAVTICVLDITNVAVTPPTCVGDTDGTITVTAVCGACQDIEYSLDGANFQASNVFTGLASGSYMVTARDVVNHACFDTASVTIGPGDLIPPVFNPPLPDSLTISCTDPIPAPETLTATDNVDPNPEVTFSESQTSGACPQEYTIVRTWTATDFCGNSAQYTQTITVDDNTPPVFNAPLPQDTTVSCSDPLTLPPTVTATDDCDPGQVPPVIFINEIHYDNAGTDAGEFIEIAGTAGLDLSQYQLVLYNGNGGVTYNEMTLSGTIDDEGNGFGAVSFPYPVNGIQNGAPDGMALVKLPNTVIQFLSYEGPFVATNGPAAGMTSVDIGVAEEPAPAIGQSLQLTGSGQEYSDFTWIGPSAESPGTLNAGQSIEPLPGTIMATLEETSMMGDCAGEMTVMRMWTATDACGNSAVYTQTIHVEDNVAPDFVPPLPQDITISCSDPVPPPADLLATDLCDEGGAGPAMVWINEIHYDNAGTDQGEFIEVAGTAGVDLSSYSLFLYNGSGGGTYGSMTLSGVIPNQSNGFGTVAFTYPVNGLQNGSPDGVALVTGGMVVQFLSYEGVFVAVGGPANGMTSTDIGVSEDGNNAVGTSLRLSGTGNKYSDFVWNAPAAATPGAINTGQSFVAAPTGLQVTFSETDNQGADPANCNFYNYTITRTWSVEDDCGNANTHVQVITVQDVTPPTFNGVPANVTISCNQAVPPVPTNVTASDNCSAVSPVTFTEVSTKGSNPANCNFYNYTITRTWSASDVCGNVGMSTQIITVQDISTPTVNCQNITVSLNIFGTVTVTGASVGFSASDNCASLENLTVLANPVTYTCLHAGTTQQYVLQVQDPCGNVGVCTSQVTILPFPRCEPKILISDPCVCKNNATTLSNGQFGETLKIESLAGKTWTVIAVNGLWAANSPAPPSAPLPIPVGTPFVENPLNSGDYYLSGIHIDDIGYSIVVQSETGQILTIGNSCKYPNPVITSDLSGPFCLYSDPVNLTGNPGDNNIASQGFTVNGAPAAQFDPGDGVGQYIIEYTVNGGTPKAAGADDPGCIQKVSVTVIVLATPTTLVCNNLVHVSLDADCEEEILPDQVLEGSYGCFDDYKVELDKTPPYGNGPWILPFVNAADIGKTYAYRVTHLVSGTTCWGNIKIEDKLPPQIECSNITLNCAITTYTPDYLASVLGILTAYPGVSDCSPVTTSYLDTWTNLECDETINGQDDISGYITRKWTAKDAWNNIATCNQIIYFQRIQSADVNLPADITVSCGAANINPASTGLPTVNAFGQQIPLFPEAGFCEFNATYNDQVIEVCDGTYKIIRTWTLYDWCLPTGNGNPLFHVQIIKVSDETGPVIACPANMTVSTDPFACCATVNLPDVVISDACSRINNVSAMVIGYDPDGQQIGMFPVSGAVTSFPGNNLWNPDTLGAFGTTPCLPAGTHTVVYQAEDDCGNTATCSFQLTVADHIPPVTACTEFTIVSIGPDDPADCYEPTGDCEGAGVTWVKASTFDQGSYDNCNNVKFTVQRMAPYSDCINGLNSVNGFLPCDDQFPDFPSEFERAVAEQDSIKFYCCEVGTTQMVILRVYQLDAFGNFAIGPDGTPIHNSCMIEVEVQDKIKPVCVSPGNVTVSCEAFDPSLWAYGKPAVYDNCCLDTAYNYQGQCGLQHLVSYTQFDTVCNKGTINRTFRVYDCHGQSSQCTQRIIVTYEQDYWIKFPNDVVVTSCDGTGNYGEPVFNGDQDCELLGVSYEDQIFTVVPDACYKIERTWTIINWCTYDPNKPCVDVPNPNPNATLNAPQNLVGPIVSPMGTPAPWNPTNTPLAPGQPSHNFAQYWEGNPNATPAIPSIANNNCFRYKQIIKIVDLQDPTVDNCPASPVEYCDYSTNDPLLWNQMYWWDGVSHDLCEGDAPLTITATDACSGANINITYLLFLDLDGDGVMETVINSNNPPAPGTVNYNNLGNPNYSGGEVRIFDGRPVLPNDIYRWANHQSVSGTSRTASVQWKTFAQLPTPSNVLGTPGIAPQLPYGTHKIKWTITDGCGNETYCEYTFVVKDCKAPTVVCLNGLSVNIMPGGMITLWAVDFLQYGEDNCTPANLLKYAIRKAGQGTGFPVDALGNPITSVTFDCSELGEQPVELWAMDLAGNASFCQTFIDVQDPDGVCTQGSKIDVAGALKTENNDGLEDANVNLQSGVTSLFDMTDDQGAYLFTNAVDVNANYTVTPTKDDNPLNGVSTYDLVLISKHILGLEPLGSPYKMIAADANKSNSITTFDIVEIRKLILGIYNELPNNTSWRFVDQDFAFPNPANPFQTQFPETKSVAGATVDQMADDFVAVKVGDVNGTAIANSLLTSDDRTASTLLFDVEDREVKAGETFTLTFKGAERVQGYQFTMNLSGLEVVNVTPGAGMSMDNFGVFADAVTTSVDGEGNEFAVTFRAVKAGRVSEMLGASSRITRAEAYSLSNNRMDVAFRFNGATQVISGVGFELYQNQPNPFVNKTVIGFHLPEAAEATLTVFDESGRMLFTQKGQFAKGYNAISVDRSLLNTTGLMYYKLETATDAATKKMIQTK
ncbi:MAG: hypothetical protein EPGJADBJ_05459 [Saprospiraceae bacterium]|nr:hypothetical protein [Saprospiraceae bacterium]